MPGNITTAYNLLVSLCNDDTNQYSQSYRYGQTVDGITYWDCSSIISYVLTKAGFFDSNPWFTTSYEDSYLVSAGLSRYNPYSVAWQAGDILLTVSGGHTEMVYDGDAAYIMGARSKNLPAADQVAIHQNTRTDWQYLYRVGSVDVSGYEWQAKATGAYLRDSYEAYANGLLAYAILYSKGWTLNAFCGLWGNVGYEGGYNPWRWQGDNVQSSGGSPWTSIGYGLTQFTPASKYIDDSNAKAISSYAPNFSDKSGNPDDGDCQIRYLDDYADYYPTSYYSGSYEDYKKCTDEAKDCAVYWLHNYERPADAGSSVEDARGSEAEYWYNLFYGINPGQVVNGGSGKKSLLFRLYTGRPKGSILIRR